jgi:hypothetical membrane protein
MATNNRIPPSASPPPAKDEPKIASSKLSRDAFNTLSGMVAITIYFLLPSIYLGGELWASQAYTPYYSYKKHFTSQLGIPYVYTDPQSREESFSPRAAMMNLNFIANGILFFVAQLFLLRSTNSPGAPTLRTIVAALYGVGIVLVGLYPGGPEEAKGNAGTWHIVGAVLAIVLGNVNSILAGYNSSKQNYRLISMGLGFTGLIGFVGFVVQLASGNTLTMGLWQRTTIYPTIAWEFVTADMLMGEISLIIKDLEKKEE